MISIENSRHNSARISADATHRVLALPGHSRRTLLQSLAAKERLVIHGQRDESDGQKREATVTKGVRREEKAKEARKRERDRGQWTAKERQFTTARG